MKTDATKRTPCEDCMNYTYDEECDCYLCGQSIELDEDEMSQFLQGSFSVCPFYHSGESGYYLSSKQ